MKARTKEERAWRIIARDTLAWEYENRHTRGGAEALHRASGAAGRGCAWALLLPDLPQAKAWALATRYLNDAASRALTIEVRKRVAREGRPAHWAGAPRA